MLYNNPCFTLNIFYCSNEQKDKTLVKQLRQSSAHALLKSFVIFRYC